MIIEISSRYPMKIPIRIKPSYTFCRIECPAVARFVCPNRFDSRFGNRMKITKNTSKAKAIVPPICFDESLVSSSRDWFAEIIIARIPIESASPIAATPRKSGLRNSGYLVASERTGCCSR